MAPIKAVTDKTSVAADAVSFATLASGCFSLVTKSIVASIAVLIISEAVTAPMIPMTNNHSDTEIL